jgi:hypothetical protein
VPVESGSLAVDSAIETERGLQVATDTTSQPTSTIVEPVAVASARTLTTPNSLARRIAIESTNNDSEQVDRPDAVAAFFANYR